MIRYDKVSFKVRGEVHNKNTSCQAFVRRWMKELHLTEVTYKNVFISNLPIVEVVFAAICSCIA